MNSKLDRILDLLARYKEAKQQAEDLRQQVTAADNAVNKVETEIRNAINDAYKTDETTRIIIRGALRKFAARRGATADPT